MCLTAATPLERQTACLSGAKLATTCRVSFPPQLSPQYRRHRGSEGPGPQPKVTQLAMVRLGLSPSALRIQLSRWVSVPLT